MLLWLNTSMFQEAVSLVQKRLQYKQTDSVTFTNVGCMCLHWSVYLVGVPELELLVVLILLSM